MVLAMIFFILFLGNILTTSSVLRDKIREKTPHPLISEKYQSFKTFLSSNYRRRSRSILYTDLRQYNEPTSQIDFQIEKAHDD